MPDRLVRDGLLSSRRVGSVSILAETLFVRLILSVCAHGRFHADPQLVKAAAVPNRPRIRTSEIASALDELQRAGLIARYTAPDGAPLLCIPRFGQRLKFRGRSPFPAPPGERPDPPGQEIMSLGDVDDPPVSVSPEEEKRKEECVKPGCSRDKGAPHTHTRESDGDWIQRLSREYPDVRIADEVRRAQAYVKRQRGEGARLSRKFFESSWLSNCTDFVDTRAGRIAGSAPQSPAEPEPEGWREQIADSVYGAGGEREVQAWAELPPEVRAYVTRQIGGSDGTLSAVEDSELGRKDAKK